MKKNGILKRIMAISIVFTLCFIAFVQSDNYVMTTSAAKTVSELEAEIKELKAKQKEYDVNIKATRGDAAKEKENQEAIENQIVTTQGLINAQNEKVAQLDAQIIATEAKLVIQEQSIKDGIEVFKLRLRAMYISGDDSIAEILLGSEDFYDMLMKMELVKRVAKHDSEMIEKLIQLKNDFEASKFDLKNQKTEQEATREEYKLNEAALNELYKKSKDMQSYLAQQEANYTNKKSDLAEKEEEMEAEIDRLIEEERLKNQAVYIGGEFTWPVPGFSYVSSGYGMRWGKLHKGIDIAGSGIHNANIVAANAGKVIYASNSYTPGYSYGRYIIVDHGGGYVTLYGHCEKVAVSVGDYVTKGQVIGYVGTTGNSTGYHLHFEIRVNGVAENPMNHYKKS